MNYLSFTLVVVVAIGAAALTRRRRRQAAARAIDAGVVSQQWLAESRREEEA